MIKLIFILFIIFILSGVLWALIYLCFISIIKNKRIDIIIKDTTDREEIKREKLSCQDIVK